MRYHYKYKIGHCPFDSQHKLSGYVGFGSLMQKVSHFTQEPK